MTMPDTSATDTLAAAGCGCALCAGQAGLAAGAFASTDAAAANGMDGAGSDVPSYVAALLPSSRPKWGSAVVGTSALVTYSFMESPASYLGSGDRAGFAAMSQTQRGAVRQALAAWAAVARITFVEVADTGIGGAIRFATNAQHGVSAAYAYYPSASLAIGGDVFIANDSSANLNPTPGSYGYKTLLHEIGHAIGLKHPGNYNAGGSGAEGPYLPAAEDSSQYTLMSYHSHPSLGYSGSPTGPALYDVAAIQALYGANTQSRTGNDTYSLANTASAFSTTIWDAAGADTIDASRQTLAATIDLRAGSFSSAGTNGAGGAAVGNIAIAYGVTIENATGGSGDDALTGNDAANLLIGGAGDDTLTGGSGDDTLDGGTGTDTAVFSGNRAGYDIARSGATVTITHRNGGADGTDTLTNVEHAQFADGRVGLRPPTVTARVTTVNSGGAVAGGSLFSASDPNGAAFTAYELIDTTAGGGYFTLNGTAEPAGTVFSVPSSALSGVAFVGAATVGSDQVSVRAYDGALWSDWTSWTIATQPPNSAPVLQANRVIPVQEGASATALGIVAPTDADGDPLTATVLTVPGAGLVRRSDGTVVSGGTGLPVAELGGLTFTPAAGFSGAAGSFSYTVTDGRGGSAQQTVALSVVSLASRLAGFDGLSYLASNPDLAAGLGLNVAAARQHFIDSGRFENRSTTGFDPYSYLAMNPDLAAGGIDRTAALQHYIQFGRQENRRTTGFGALSYLAGNPDLFDGFGLDEAAATRHYIQYGRAEGRNAGFDALSYLAGNPDLLDGFGLDEAAAIRHYIQYGRAEGRNAGFDALSYLAANPDLLAAFGTDTAAATRHYIQYGRAEGRGTSFDASGYLGRNPDLAAAYGGNTRDATLHYVQHGFQEGRMVTPSSMVPAEASLVRAAAASGFLAAV
ncbi:M10 family metallopeptidase C-terminal domain-containing protein [Azospirillum doebereinerae]